MDSCKVEGLDKLAAALRELPQRLGRNVLRGAVAAGATVIRNEARLHAPVYTGDVAQGHPPPGTLKRAIFQVRVREKSDDKRQVFIVSVKQGKKYRVQGKRGDKSQDAYYWRWVEMGTVNMPARPFLRPAFDAKKEEAVAAIAGYLANRIPQEVGNL